jgi:pSer/pThr/pTyr-binding forkhead associated (FHA) protein/tetratricopeptide (TPR) repeat protein
MKITLRVFDDSGEIQSKTLGEGVFRAGRSEFCDVVLPDDKVSRAHVELRVNEVAVYFTNMSSPGQVKLNGKPKETGEIADGDELVVGPYKILFAYGEAAESAAPASEEAQDAGDEAPAEGGFGAPPDGDFGAGDAPAEGFGDAGGFGDQLSNHAEPARASEGSRAASSMSIGHADTDIEGKPLVAKLIFTEGPKKGEELVLEAYEITFGRSKKADIFVDDERLSRVHCKIARVGMGYRLVDLESRNGTYVNGVRVLEHPLASFDEIEFGDTKLKFLIHDVIIPGMNGMEANQATSLVSVEGSPIEQTESVAIGALSPDQLLEIQAPPGEGRMFEVRGQYDNAVAKIPKLSRRTQVMVGAVLGLLLIFLILPGGESSKNISKATATETADKLADVKLPPTMPKEYTELTEDVQRALEGHYNSALKAADVNDFENAVAHLKSIHESLPYYKKSRELFEKYDKKLKEKRVVEAQDKAKNDEKQDLAMYLQDGIEYLKEGDFEKAGEAFNSAIVIDPTNPIAAKGLRASDAKVRDMEQLPPEIDPEMEKKKVVIDLFQRAVAALQQKQYQEAINTADQVRKIELRGDTQYLNEAKQIIDQAKILQKEEFEPFLISAKEKFAEGDYSESRNLCDEMLKKDSSYEEARECVLKAKKNLSRLAKEAYTHGYILESMNRIEEAKQYWNRAKNYTRPGDDYYDKVVRKLDYYQ